MANVRRKARFGSGCDRRFTGVGWARRTYRYAIFKWRLTRPECAVTLQNAVLGAGLTYVSVSTNLLA